MDGRTTSSQRCRKTTPLTPMILEAAPMVRHLRAPIRASAPRDGEPPPAERDLSLAEVTENFPLDRDVHLRCRYRRTSPRQYTAHLEKGLQPCR